MRLRSGAIFSGEGIALGVGGCAELSWHFELLQQSAAICKSRAVVLVVAFRASELTCVLGVCRHMHRYICVYINT